MITLNMIRLRYPMNRRHFLGLSGSALLGGCTSQASTPTEVPLMDDRETAAADRSTRTDEPNPMAFEDKDVASTHGSISAKIDLHTHLRRGGGQQMADRYAELGFDALIGTDHHGHVEPPVPGHSEAEQVEDYSDLEFPGPILNGIELSEGQHINVIKSESEMIKQINHPMVKQLTVEEIRELSERIGAELIEVTDDGVALDRYPTLTECVEDLGLNPTVTSDAHDIGGIGTGYVVAEVTELTGDAIIRSLRQGNYSLGGMLW